MSTTRRNILTEADPRSVTSANASRLLESLISAVIVAVLAFQLLANAGLTPGPIEEPPFLWPFVDYPMYAGTKERGTPIPRYEIVGETEDGEQVEITPQTLGTSFFIFRKSFVLPFLNPNRRGDLREGADLFEELHDTRLNRVRVRDSPLVLSPEGLQERGSYVVGVAVRDPAGDSWSWPSR